MFSRTPPPDSKATPADFKPFDATKPFDTKPGPPNLPAASAFSGSTAAPAASRSAGAGFAMGSLIGSDLTISGQGLRIVTRGTLQVDGLVEGDVVGNEVVIGEKGHVTGMVSGESVIVRGRVSGTIRAVTVALVSGSHVEGDVHHHQLSVEQGAHLDGRVRRPQDATELKPQFDVPPKS